MFAIAKAIFGMGNQKTKAKDICERVALMYACTLRHEVICSSHVL